MPSILLADEDDDRSAVDPSRCECGYRVAQACGRVEKRERRFAPPEHPAGGEPDDGGLVQPKHQTKVVRKSGQKWDLGRAWIAENRREPAVPEDVEGRVADRSLAHAASIA